MNKINNLQISNTVFFIQNCQRTKIYSQPGPVSPVVDGDVGGLRGSAVHSSVTANDHASTSGASNNVRFLLYLCFTFVLQNYSG